MPGQPEQHVNEGCCKFCGARLSLVKRMSRQEFCSNEHREQFLQADGGAALGRLQETARPRPSTAPGSGPLGGGAGSGGVKPTGSILGLSAQPSPPVSRAETPRAAPVEAAPASSAAPARVPPAGMRTAAPPAATTAPAPAAAQAGANAAPAVTTMALARTKQRPKAPARPGQLDPALNRLMEASSSMQQPPAARAPMRFTAGAFAQPEATGTASGQGAVQAIPMPPVPERSAASPEARKQQALPAAPEEGAAEKPAVEKQAPRPAQAAGVQFAPTAAPPKVAAQPQPAAQASAPTETKAPPQIKRAGQPQAPPQTKPAERPQVPPQTKLAEQPQAPPQTKLVEQLQAPPQTKLVEQLQVSAQPQVVTQPRVATQPKVASQAPTLRVVPPVAEAAMPAGTVTPVRSEPEVEVVTVEKRGARPPASFVLTGQMAYGSREPRAIEDGLAFEPVALTPVSLPQPPEEPESAAVLKIDGERLPGTVEMVYPVAGDLMTILVVRATPALLPGIMELPAVPGVEPHDWQAFGAWVRHRIREEDGPEPSGSVEMWEIEPRPLGQAIVQALFGADRFWPNPKTYIVYPSRELMRRPLLQHAELPVEQDTVPLLVSRNYEAAHRRVMAEWSPIDAGAPIPTAGAPIPTAGAVAAPMAPKQGGGELQGAPSQPTAMQAQSVLPQSRLTPSPVQPAGEAGEGGGAGLSAASVQQAEGGMARGALSRGTGFGPAAGESRPPERPRGPVVPGATGGDGEDWRNQPADPFTARTPDPAMAYMTGPGAGIVLPRFGYRMGTRAESLGERPLVVLHRQPPTAKMVTLVLEAADRAAAPAPAPPMVTEEIQPEIRHTISGIPPGGNRASLRFPSMVGLDGTEKDFDSAVRNDEESMSWSWLESTLPPAAPAAGLRVRRASVPVLRTAVRLPGADRATELFLSPTPVEFTATVDQWSAL